MSKEIILEDPLGLSDKPESKRNFWQPWFATGPYDLEEKREGGYCPKLEPETTEEPGPSEPPELLEELRKLEPEAQQALANILKRLAEALM